MTTSRIEYALERAALRQCLQPQIDGLNEVVMTNSSFGLEQKAQLAAALDRIGQAVTLKLDHMEQAVRELLQIVGCLSATSHPKTNIKEKGTCLGFHK